MATMLLRLPELLRSRGRTRSSHYADVRSGLFTRPVRTGLRTVGWPDNEVQALIEARIAGATDNEVRELVRKLEAARAAAPAFRSLADAGRPSPYKEETLIAAPQPHLLDSPKGSNTKPSTGRSTAITKNDGPSHDRKAKDNHARRNPPVS